MTDLQLRNWIGVLIILANLGILALAFVIYLNGGFLFDEMTTIISLIFPMFSVYTTAIIKSIVATRNDTSIIGKPVTGMYVFISWLFPVGFIFALVGIILLKAFNIGFSSFEQFKNMLVATETVFGAYVGIVMASMFKIVKTKKNSS